MFKTSLKWLVKYLTLSISLVPFMQAQSSSWPTVIEEMVYTSSLDQSAQPALIYKARTKNRPLLVALHTWSSDYLQKDGAAYAKWCIENDWNLIHPNFRGPNNKPEALGSEYVVCDIESAVATMMQLTQPDSKRVYLIGVSGGGHAALLMAGRKPELWAGVSTWCGISDIQQWWQEKTQFGPKQYAEHIEMACGNPTEDAFKDHCRARSPLSYLNHTISVPLDINHGLYDGRKGSVPFTHSIRAFNAVANSEAVIPKEVMADFYQSLTPPPSIQKLKDPLYGKRQPLFRVQSNRARLTIFDGKHEIIYSAGLNWLAKQVKGDAPIWNIKGAIEFNLADEKLNSGL